MTKRKKVRTMPDGDSLVTAMIEAAVRVVESDALKVHPLADRFPMLPDSEIADLAEDIKAHGLIHPLMVDGDTLIDGRNRLKACNLAGVEPTFRPFPYDGDPAGKEAAITA